MESFKKVVFIFKCFQHLKFNLNLKLHLFPNFMFLYFNTNLGEDKNSSSSFTSDYFNNIFRLGHRRFRIPNDNTFHIFYIELLK